MFLGEFEHSVDSKGRVAVPARFREALAEGLVLTRGFDRCLQAFPQPIWDELARRVSASSLGSEEARHLRRLLFSGASEVELDRQGRIVVPPNLRDYAGLTERVIVAGLNTYFEIWAYDRWQDVLSALDNSTNAMAGHLADLGV